jgi:hypothetical protein
MAEQILDEYWNQLEEAIRSVVRSSKNKQHVDNLKQRLGGREDEMDLSRKRDFRGYGQTSSMMAISSSKLSSPSRGDGTRIQGQKNNNNGTDTFASSHWGMDALDLAQNLQEGNRLPSSSYNNSNYTKTMGRYMDNIPQLGMRSMNNHSDDNDSLDDRFNRRGEEDHYNDGMSTDDNAKHGSKVVCNINPCVFRECSEQANDSNYLCDLHMHTILMGLMD